MFHGTKEMLAHGSWTRDQLHLWAICSGSSAPPWTMRLPAGCRKPSAMGPPAVAHSYFIPAYERMGLRPGLPLALLWGGAELVGGFLIASGLVTPEGTALLAAVMTVAILTVHLRHREFPGPPTTLCGQVRPSAPVLACSA